MIVTLKNVYDLWIFWHDFVFQLDTACYLMNRKDGDLIYYIRFVDKFLNSMSIQNFEIYHTTAKTERKYIYIRWYYEEYT